MVGRATDAPVVASDVTVPTEGVAYINDTTGNPRIYRGHLYGGAAAQHAA